MSPRRGRRWGSWAARWSAVRSVQAAAPALVGLAALATAACAVVVISAEAPRSGVLSRVYAAVDLFAGNYLPVAGQPGSPSPAMAGVGLAALLITFTAAFTALLSLTARAREWVRARRAGAQLVVIGSGRPAAEILRSAPPSTSRGLLLVTGSRSGAAALAARGRAAALVTDLDALAVDGDDLAELGRRGGTVAVATDDDALNISIAENLTRARGGAGGKVMALVGHAPLAEELRPPVIAGDLRLPYGISCPSENIAERICHHLDQLLSHDRLLREAGRGVVVIEGDGGHTARTVETWVRRFTWSRSFLRGVARRPVPVLHMADEAHGEVAAATIRVFVGDDPAATAAQTLRAVRLFPGADCRWVAVTSARLQGGRLEGITVVDARSAAWDQRLVFDDIAEQWGRVYHSAYGVVFDSFTDWAEVHTGRSGQSSIAAGQHTLALLARHGFELVRVDGRPLPPDFTAAELTAMAAAGHAEWRARTWVDEAGVRHRVAEGSDYDVAWDALDERARGDNEALTAATAPALAALFGYAVRRVGTSAEEVSPTSR